MEEAGWCEGAALIVPSFGFWFAFIVSLSLVVILSQTKAELKIHTEARFFLCLN